MTTTPPAPANISRYEYTAVVYVHGMGSQRRLEELSRLVDALDRYAHHRIDDTGLLTDIGLRLEPSRTDAKPEVSYIRLDRQYPKGHELKGRQVHRFYEAYWANITADGVSTKEVALWLLAQVGVPFQALRTCWRLRARLRRAALHRLWPRIASVTQDLAKSDMKNLLTEYDRFEGWDARRDWPHGKAADFEQFIAGKPERPPAQAARLVALARCWRWGYVGIELKNLFALITIALAMGLIALGAIALVLWVLQHAVPALAHGPLGNLLPKADWKTAASGAGLLLVAVGGGRFLSDFLGDVQFWTTYEETSVKNRKRREILDRCSNTLRHVLADDLCTRVVLVAHSLGTTVAFDTLLALARTNRSQSPRDETQGSIRLDKIQHFITLASPIDKVHYFFESHAGKYHRYNRVVEELRGDIGTYPFARSGRPLIHWINFWDRADVISGALHTPTNRAFPSLTVDNVETSNLRLPDANAAHSAYFQNARVIGTIFGTVFDNTHNFALAPMHTPPGKAEPRPDYSAQRLGPGQVRSSANVFHALLLTLPWVAVAAALSAWADVGWLASGLGAIAAAIVVLVVVVSVATALHPAPCDPLD